MAICLSEERTLKELQVQYSKREYNDFLSKSSEELPSLENTGKTTLPGPCQ
jgi:adenylate/nucleoside-diphosphate kinase